MIKCVFRIKGKNGIIVKGASVTYFDDFITCKNLVLYSFWLLKSFYL